MYTLFRSSQAFETWIHSFKPHIQIYNILRKAGASLSQTSNKEHLFPPPRLCGDANKEAAPQLGKLIHYCCAYNCFIGLCVTLFYTHYSCLNTWDPISITNFFQTDIKHTSSTNKHTSLSHTCLSYLAIILHLYPSTLKLHTYYTLVPRQPEYYTRPT